MRKSEIVFGFLRVPVDFLMVILSFWLAYIIRPYSDLIPGVQFQLLPSQLPTPLYFLKLSLISSSLLIAIFGINGLYKLKTTYKFITEIFKIVFSGITWILIIIAYYSLIAHQLFFSRIVLAHIFVFTVLFIILGRIFIRLFQLLFLHLGIGRRRLLFVGVDKNTEHIAKTLNKDWRYEIIGVVAENIPGKKPKTKLKILGIFPNVGKIIKKYNIHEIIRTESFLSAEEANNLITLCQTEHISYKFIPDLLKVHYSHVEVSALDDLPILELKETPLDGWQRIIKRIFDIIISFFLIIIFSPVFIFLGILIKIDSKGSVFYSDFRVGHKGEKLFKMYKFRSMKKGADKEKTKLKKLNMRKGPLFKIKNDPRITKFGKFLRKSSLDELPQLFNVILGQMSLIGPRPHLKEEVVNYKPHHKRVLTIKPGMTGLSQISGRSDINFETEVKLDTYYIENWSLILDIKILWKTLFAVVKGKGAN